MITLWGYKVYETHTAFGVMIAVFGAMLDRLDGKMAFVLKQILSPPSQWSTGLMGHLFADVTTLHVTEERIDMPEEDYALGNHQGFKAHYRRLRQALKKHLTDYLRA